MRRVSARPRGVTLIELMVALAVLALLVSAGVPFMGDMVVNSRLRAAGNLLFTEALVAQSEAIKRNTTVRVSTNGDTVQVHDMTDPGNPALLRERTLPESATAPVGNFSLGADGRPAPFGTAVAINLALASGTCSADLRCPGLRVDAGGAARLCPDHQVSCP